MPFKVPLGEQGIPPENGELTPDEQEMLRALAQKVVDWRMTVPAILTLESVKPLNWIGSQAMVFFEPFVTAIFSKPLSIKNYNLFRQMMERRENVERLLQKIEELDAIQLEQEREQKRKLKAKRKIKRKRFWRKLLGREKPEDLNPPKF